MEKKKKTLENFFLRFQKVTLNEKIFFTKNLVVMIRAGIPLSEAVEILSSQTKNKKFRKILKDIKADIEGGISLAKSISKYPDVFPEIFVNMIECGEQSGQLEKVLEELTNQMKRSRALASKLKRALAYPLFVIFIMIVVGIFALTFILPKITSILEEMNVELPLTTKILIGLSKFVTKRGYFLLIALVIFAYLFYRFSKTKKGKYFLDSLVLKLPIIGGLIKKINLIKFSRTFTSLLASGVPLVKTFQITSTVLSNSLYQEKVLSLSQFTSKGVTISSVLKKYPDLFPLIITHVIEIGERTGTLETILGDVIEFYEDDVDETLTNFTSIIEPLLIVILGIAVAIMALAIISPMYSLVQTI
jgi:type IV pilus assembly protein PilC